jgi:hypothetical protein
MARLSAALLSAIHNHPKKPSTPGQPRLANVRCAPPELSFSTVLLLSACHGGRQLRERDMHGLIYLIGLIVVILFILSLFGLR